MLEYNRSLDKGSIMLFRIIIYLCLSLLFTACQNHVTLDAKQQAGLQKQAISIVQQFVGTLKPQLKQALQEGGPEHAIAVCSEIAPKLAKTLSEKTGWQIKRVSLKARNHHTALPDTWEQSMLQRFNRDQAQGKPPAMMIASRREHGIYRFMQAQAVAPVCLLCHGKKISPDVAKVLKKYYPQDQATGYELGQIRGAFSLSKRL